MAHAYAGADQEAIRTVVRPALARYLRLNVEMQKDNSSGKRDEKGLTQLNERESEILINMRLNSDLNSELSFVGTLDHCVQQARRLHESGVDEIACLIDFGVGHQDVMDSLRRLSTLLP